jgi:putative DNA primase/helicase
VKIDDRGGVAHCHRCGYVENRFDDEVRTRAGRPLPRAVAPTRHEVLSDYGRQLWHACRPVSGDARAYLEARCCVIPPEDGDLRYLPALKHTPSGYIGPALVALVTDAVTREPLTLHRTWIKANGDKADVDPPRMLLGGHRKAGGVVRLWPDEAVTHGMGIAEGIETALSLAHAFQPAWACIDAANMAGLAPLDGVDSLLIAADHDDAGIAAAEACGARWVDAGKEVGIVVPDTHKTDLNDLARAAA